LDASLQKAGPAKLDGTVDVRGKMVPAMFYGARRINNNYDAVDALKKETGATATVFVKDGEEFVRISTNVLTPEGKRGVGTQLARNQAYAGVNGGGSYCGDIDVLGTQYSSCYNAIKDASGKVIGATYIGYKK